MRHNQAGQQPTEHAMADDEFGQRVARDGVLRGAGQRQQHPVALQPVGQAGGAASGHHESRRGAAE